MEGPRPAQSRPADHRRRHLQDAHGHLREHLRVRARAAPARHRHPQRRAQGARPREGHPAALPADVPAHARAQQELRPERLQLPLLVHHAAVARVRLQLRVDAQPRDGEAHGAAVAVHDAHARDVLSVGLHVALSHVQGHRHGPRRRADPHHHLPEARPLRRRDHRVRPRRQLAAHVPLVRLRRLRRDAQPALPDDAVPVDDPPPLGRRLCARPRRRREARVGRGGQGPQQDELDPRLRVVLQVPRRPGVHDARQARRRGQLGGRGAHRRGHEHVRQRALQHGAAARPLPRHREHHDEPRPPAVPVGARGLGRPAEQPRGPRLPHAVRPVLQPQPARALPVHGHLRVRRRRPRAGVERAQVRGAPARDPHEARHRPDPRAAHPAVVRPRRPLQVERHGRDLRGGRLHHPALRPAWHAREDQRLGHDAADAQLLQLGLDGPRRRAADLPQVGHVGAREDRLRHQDAHDEARAQLPRAHRQEGELLLAQDARSVRAAWPLARSRVSDSVCLCHTGAAHPPGAWIVHPGLRTAGLLDPEATFASTVCRRCQRPEGRPQSFGIAFASRILLQIMAAMGCRRVDSLS
mmetsp:Transcript_30242/g.93313  ORF Transcript_30242/g.93313 Transcript_30242/m.93313 type:complete len:582 (-) Transcript_30242:46-1791(-)